MQDIINRAEDNHFNRGKYDSQQLKKLNEVQFLVWKLTIFFVIKR